MNHVKCIIDNHVNSARATWCGKPENRTEFRFTDIDQAAMNGRNGGRLTVCPQCRKAVIAGLRNQEVQS